MCPSIACWFGSAWDCCSHVPSWRKPDYFYGLIACVGLGAISSMCVDQSFMSIPRSSLLERLIYYTSSPSCQSVSLSDNTNITTVATCTGMSC